jgi:predicted short-subunit dehydrogenase-like oxidoreductase (DUF2520 family)
LARNKDIKTKVVIIGSGNLAWHVVSHLVFFKRFEISVYNRSSSERLVQLKKEFKVPVTTKWKEVPKDAAIYFICSGDKSIKGVAERLKKIKTKALVLHTSGSSPLSFLKGASENIGVFYPLQTFSFGKSVNWSEVPVFIEASNNKSIEILQRLAKLFSRNATKLDSKQRLKLHLAAVIAGNFSNAMYSAAYLFLAQSDKKLFDHLLPLIITTAKKLRSVDPVSAQTGPAVRKDNNTQKAHLALLKDHPDLKKIYKAISKLIVKQHKPYAKF